MNLKGKIVAGAVSVSLLTGVGTAFANTDAGQQLQTWYNNKFVVSKAAIALSQDVYSGVESARLSAEAVKLGKTTVGAVKQAGSDQIASANAAINAAKKEHSDAIQAKKTEIETNAPGEYDAFVAERTETVNKRADSVFNPLQAGMEKAVNDQGTASVNAVNTQVGKTKADAIAALEQEIKAAKEELNNLIEKESIAATKELKENFDKKIVEVRGKITAKMTELENLKKGEIEKAGKDIQDSAKAELDALVGKISRR